MLFKALASPENTTIRWDKNLFLLEDLCSSKCPLKALLYKKRPFLVFLNLFFADLDVLIFGIE